MTGRLEQIEAIIFDMDGLLFDSERIVQRSWNDVGDRLGFSYVGNHIYRTLGMNRAGRLAYFTEAIGAEFPFEEFCVQTRKRFYEIVKAEGLPVKPGVKELLWYGKDKGYRMAVATSSSKDYAYGNLKNAGIERFFDGFVYGDMVQHAKPDPEIYQRACKTVKSDPKRSLALEDAPAGIRSAYGAGLIPIVVPDLVEPDEEIRKLAYRRCDSLFDVIELLEKNEKLG